MTQPLSPLTADLFITHLGKPLEMFDEDILECADNPDFALAADSPIAGISFKRFGFSITYATPDFYHNDVTLSVEPAIITNVQLYSADEYKDQIPYPHALPHGVQFSDDRKTLWQKLGSGKWVFPYREPVKLERWDFDKNWLLVVYSDDMQSIRMVQIGLKPLQPKPSVLPKITQPDIHVLRSLFELPWEKVAKYKFMRKMDFSDLASMTPINHTVRLDEVKRYGMALYFHPHRNSPEDCVFIGVEFLRKGVWGSKGFDGDLPCGLRFDDNLETVIQKIDRHPDAEKADALNGYYIWKLPEFLLHVDFSVGEQRVNRIRITAHPYYSLNAV